MSDKEFDFLVSVARQPIGERNSFVLTNGVSICLGPTATTVLNALQSLETRCPGHAATAWLHEVLQNARAVN